MATIYRFIVEQQNTGAGGTGNGSTKRVGKGAGKTAQKGRWVSLFGGEKGGVESNRKMRAINPVLNKLTNGVWEKGTRLARAGAGLVKQNTATGKYALSGPAIAIIIAFILQFTWNTISKFNQLARAKAETSNTQNFTAMENGGGTIHGAYDISRSVWSGQITYNQNK